MKVKYFTDTPPIVLALQGGSINVFPQVPYQGSQALFSDSNISVSETPSSEYRTLQMRVDQAPFNDKNLRLAVAYALDRPGLVSGLFNGKAELGNDHAFAPIYPGSPTTDQVPQRVKDIDKAKSLVGGSTVNVTLTTEQFLEIPEYAQFMKQMLAPAGINVKLDIQPQGTFYGTGANQPWLQVPFGITDWGARGTAGQTIDPAYLCRSVPNTNLSNSGAWNSAHWCDPAFDKPRPAVRGRGRRAEAPVAGRPAAKIQQAEVPDVIAYWIKRAARARATTSTASPVGPTFHLDASAMWHRREPLTRGPRTVRRGPRGGRIELDDGPLHPEAPRADRDHARDRLVRRLRGRRRCSPATSGARSWGRTRPSSRSTQLDHRSATTSRCRCATGTGRATSCKATGACRRCRTSRCGRSCWAG